MPIKLFNNVKVYRIEGHDSLDHIRDMSERLENHQLQGEEQARWVHRRGFVPAIAYTGEFVSGIPGSRASLLRVGILEKKISPEVVGSRVRNQVDSIREQERREVGAPERREIKARVIADLARRTDPAERFVHMILDGPYLYVDQVTPSRAEEAINLLREALGSLPVRPLEPRNAVSQVMTDWVGNDCETDHTTVSAGDSFKAIDRAEGATLSGSRVDLSSARLRRLLEQGYRLQRMGLQVDHDDIQTRCSLVAQTRGFALTGIKWPAEIDTRIELESGDARHPLEHHIEQRRVTLAVLLPALRSLVSEVMLAMGGEDLP